MMGAEVRALQCGREIIRRSRVLCGMESSIRGSSSRALTMPKDALSAFDRGKGPLNIEQASMAYLYHKFFRYKHVYMTSDILEFSALFWHSGKGF